ncbi:U32 family peptidase [uncultured Dysosmobacter sp.]|uniref:U32 family peptidase n=1 Tax=uncultured Dysosmobacter sp. TaxID=2591384 RepID=UPI0026387980|nr:U32 family peptidase [uncultured Dysosmobacter sp.]
MKPELLAPAGSLESLRAAVQNGADAVYLGWSDFNARRGAKNFSDEEFADALAYCHVRGVRVFLTLNTLLTDRELPQALETAAAACRMGVDSILVQDWGLFDLMRRSLPDLPLHASTQMSVFTSGGAVEMAADGCERVVLARECSAEDTRAICQNCSAEIEVFVHGALCMCYSGQCAMSALIGGRSGNRGRCAQPCRLPYGVNEPARKKYPLSLKDNCLAGELGAMADMGVACLKMEGRMKRPEYVAVITRIYARLLEEGRGPTAREESELKQAFSRSGFTDWYWQGKHGAPMLGVRPENAADPKELFDAAKAAYEKDDLRTIPVRFACQIRTGIPCALTAADRDGHTITVTGPVPEAARSRSITAAEVSDRLKKTGGTAFRCEQVDAAVDEGLSLPASAINALRRDALAAMTQARTAAPVRRELPVPDLPDLNCAADAPQFTVSVTHAAQLTGGLLDLRPARTYVPLELLAGLSALPASDTAWCAILPRVWRDRDEPELRRWLDHARALGVTGVLAGNIGHLPLVREMGFALYGDFGLNVFNTWSLDYLRGKGLASACVSFELRFAQIRDLQKIIPAEAIVYGRLPLMITENCIIQNDRGCRCDRPNFLNDRTGASFPLLPAYGHRTEIQNSKVLWLADRPEWRRLGLAYARLRFTTETPEECVRVFRGYLDGAAAPGEFTRGLYERGVE